MIIKLFRFLLLLTFLFVNVEAQTESMALVQGNAENPFMNPVFSPNGKMIAFTGINYQGIWILNLETNNVKQISDEVSAGFGFKWSPDSKYILSRVALYEGMNRLNAVKLFGVETGESKLLTEYRTKMPSLPDWAATSEMVFINNDMEVEFFTTGIEVTESQSGSNKNNISFIRNNKVGLMDLNTNEIKILDPVNGSKYLNLSLSPDNQKIVFEVYGGNLFVMNVDGTSLTDLGKGYRAKWSPDSEYIICQVSTDDGHTFLTSDIYKIKIDGSEKINLTVSDNRLEMNPCFSPDGKQVVFDAFDDGSIYLMNLE